MKHVLRLIFSGIIVTMLVVTATASLDRSVFVALGVLWPDTWFRATLADAYFGFLTFYIWVFYKEKSILKRILWFVLIMVLGNFAMAGYVLIQLAKLDSGEPLEHILLRKTS